jgi:hypothetical protein
MRGLLANNKDIVQGVRKVMRVMKKAPCNYGQTNNRLIGDFTRDLWQITDGPKNGQQGNIIGKKTLRMPLPNSVAPLPRRMHCLPTAPCWWAPAQTTT